MVLLSSSLSSAMNCNRGTFSAIRDPSSVSLFDLSSIRSMEAPPTKEMLKCPFCELPLRTVNEADSHIRKVHKHEVHLAFGCSECDKRFMEIGQAMVHFERNPFCHKAIMRVHIPHPHQLVPPPRPNIFVRLLGMLKR